MPLSKLFARYRDELRAFVRSPRSSCLFLHCAPDLDALCAKLVASIDQEPTSREVVLAYSGTFHDAGSYYAAAAQAAVDNVAQHRAALAAQDVAFGFPDGLEASLRATVSVEQAFAEFAERCSRALAKNVARCTVFVLHCANAEALPLFTASTRQLASLAATERTKFIVFVGAEPELPQTLAAPQRLHVVEARRSEERVPALQSFVAAPARRVLVMRAGAVSNEAIARDVDAVLANGSYYSKALYLTLRPQPIADAAHEAACQLQACAARQDVHLTLDATLHPLDAFAELCEQWARRQVEPQGTVVVAIDLHGWRDVHGDAGRDWLLRLSLAACSARVQYVVVERTPRGLLPVMVEAPRETAALHVRVDQHALEHGLRAKLDDPATTPAERIECLGGLASMASAHRRHEEALQLHDEALGLLAQVDDAALSFVVWLRVGQSLYAAHAWQAAATAHRKALAIALASGNAGGIAHATLSLADALLCADELADAETCYRSAVAWYEKVGAPLFACHARTWLGETQRRAGDRVGGARTWDEALARYDELGPDFRDATLEGKKQVLQRLALLYEGQRDQRNATRSKQALAELGDAPIVTQRP